jgi:hypothetical protein
MLVYFTQTVHDLYPSIIANCVFIGDKSCNRACRGLWDGRDFHEVAASHRFQPAVASLLSLEYLIKIKHLLSSSDPSYGELKCIDTCRCASPHLEPDQPWARTVRKRETVHSTSLKSDKISVDLHSLGQKAGYVNWNDPAHKFGRN